MTGQGTAAAASGICACCTLQRMQSRRISHLEPLLSPCSRQLHCCLLLRGAELLVGTGRPAHHLQQSPQRCCCRCCQT
jgi:hypothetical protein